MNTFENIITRRSTRKYLDKEVSQELLEKIIETGRYATLFWNSPAEGSDSGCAVMCAGYEAPVPPDQYLPRSVHKVPPDEYH